MRLPFARYATGLALVWAGSQFLPVNLAVAQSAPAETIGRLSGDDISVKSQGSTDTENGRSTTNLTSGSDITLRSGHATIALQEGGDIDVCGPAHLSLFKTGGTVTVALDFGRVHPHVGSAVVLNVFTPQIVATPVAIGQSARDVTIGLDQQGEMCALASRGALRIEQQLSGQSLLVPEGGETSLTGGQLKPMPSATVNCTCEVPITQKIAPAPATQPAVELSVPARPSGMSTPKPAPDKPPASAPPPAASDQPVYRVDMPPLTFGANLPTPPPDPDPQTMLLVRQSRVETGVVFQGHVTAAENPARETQDRRAAEKAAEERTNEPKRPNVFARFFGLFRKHKPAP